ncbi:MAG TPA: DUF4159 domain-containing protein [Terriglobia bacterium]|nr:DUF4159 domain-containing protein [Terriglobia bacterium]
MRKALLVIACLAASVSAYAQFGRQGFFGGGRGEEDGPEYREKDESGFVYGRVRYHMLPNRLPEIPWHHDYPLADETFPDSLQRLTSTHTTRESYQIVDIDSKELFRYPYVYLCEPGYLDLLPDDVKNLREYLDRGGFLFIDDFRGYEHLANLQEQLKKVYPEREIVELDASHQIFHSFYDIDSLEMTPPYSTGGSGGVRFLGLSDPKGRLVAIIDFNNDLSEFWEWLDEGEKPLEESAKSIRLGVNYAMYAMTH